MCRFAEVPLARLHGWRARSTLALNLPTLAMSFLTNLLILNFPESFVIPYILIPDSLKLWTRNFFTFLIEFHESVAGRIYFRKLKVYAVSISKTILKFPNLQRIEHVKAIQVLLYIFHENSNFSQCCH